MATQITLTTELSRERLLALRDEIDALLGDIQAQQGGGTAESPAKPTATSATEAAARKLLSRIGPPLQAFVRFAVERYDGQTFTWEDVAADMGENLGTVKSWHRSLSKPMNRLLDEHPGMPAAIEGIGYDGRSHYRIGAGWSRAISSTWGTAGQR
jgi:DNA-directed RNA polymerase specialized sigma24 family protein